MSTLLATTNVFCVSLGMGNSSNIRLSTASVMEPDESCSCIVWISSPTTKTHEPLGMGAHGESLIEEDRLEEALAWTGGRVNLSTTPTTLR